MSKRPALNSLAGRLAPKATAPVEPAEVVEEAAASRGRKAGAQPDGRKGVLLRLNPQAWFQLKSMAAEQTMERDELFTMQSALEEALNDWFRKHGKPPIA